VKRRYDHLVPWILLLLIVGATLAVVQAAVTAMLR
jgi:hypothetical protein